MGTARPAGTIVENLERRYLLALFAPDLSFGDGGRVDVPSEYVLTLLPDGDILTVGERRTPRYDLFPLLIAARVNPDGTLDESFGTGGSIDFGLLKHGAAPSGTGFVIVSDDPTPPSRVAILEKYTSAGVLDTSFAGDGKLDVPTTHGVGTGDRVQARIVATTGDGGLLVRVENPNRDELVKIEANGDVDTSFGEDGFLADPPNEQMLWTDRGLLVVDEDFTTDVTTLKQYLPDGMTPDTTFGTGGTLVIPTPVRGIAVQPDGKLLVVRSPDGSESGTRRLYRLNEDGSPDGTFGTGGSVPLNDVRFGFDAAAIAVDAQQRIVVSGRERLYRFNPSGVLDPDINGSFEVVGGPPAFDASGLILIGGTQVTRYAERAPVDVGRDDVLYVTGGAGNDAVTIGAGAAGKINVSLNGDVTAVDAAGLIGINVELEEGDNALTVSVDLPTTVTSGAGDDTLTTAGGDDSITAGFGDNVIEVGDGVDSVEAGESAAAGIGDDDHHVVTGGDGTKNVLVQSGDVDVTLGTGDSVIDARYAGQLDVSIAGGSNRVTMRLGTAQIGGAGDNDVEITEVGSVTTGDGNDRIRVGAGTVSGGGGDDFFDIAGSATLSLTVFAGDGNDTAFTSDFYASAVTVFGGDGNDFLEGQLGHQTFYGEAGNDTLLGGVGSDLLDGGGGNDQLIGGSGVDRLYAGAGDDTLEGGAGDDRLFGHEGNDKLYGGDGNDQLLGGVGHDWLFAQRGNDELFGEGGNDRLYADYDSGVATLHGGNGNDLLVTADGLVDHLFGDAGTDRAIADENDDVQEGTEQRSDAQPIADVELPGLLLNNGLLAFVGGDAGDRVSVYPDGAGGLVASVNGATRTFDLGRVARINLAGNGGNDLLKLHEHLAIRAVLSGGDGDDSLIGGASNDHLSGGGGKDYMDGGRGGDNFRGGTERDTVDYSSRTANLVIRISGVNDPPDDGEVGENDNVPNDVERVIGGSGDDRIGGSTADNILVGNEGDDSLSGHDGRDILYGGGGNDHLDGGNRDDVLEGGAGHDVLHGGADADRFLALAGNDALLAAGDGAQDIVDGGIGTDRGDVDEDDAVTSVEVLP